MTCSQWRHSEVRHADPQPGRRSRAASKSGYSTARLAHERRHAAPATWGVFGQVVGTINPSLTANAYPTSWAAGTETFTLSGLDRNAIRRIAFHTFYPTAGSAAPTATRSGWPRLRTRFRPRLRLGRGPAPLAAASGTIHGNWSPSGVPSSNIDNQITFGATTHAVMTNDIAGTLVVIR